MKFVIIKKRDVTLDNGEVVTFSTFDLGNGCTLEMMDCDSDFLMQPRKKYYNEKSLRKLEEELLKGNHNI